MTDELDYSEYADKAYDLLQELYNVDITDEDIVESCFNEGVSPEECATRLANTYQSDDIADDSENDLFDDCPLDDYEE